MQYIKDNLEKINENIAAACEKSNRNVSSVSMVAVTKAATIEQIKELVRLGHSELGESRLVHLKQVSGEISDFIENHKFDQNFPQHVNWHMIGHLQRNKVRQILPIVRMIHSVDTLRLAEEISQDAKKQGIEVETLLQVNCSQEPQKYGIPVGAAVHLAEQMCSMDNIKLLGLMTMAPFTEDEKAIRHTFVRCREIFEDISKQRFAGNQFQHLSMGMSNDYHIAVQEGATILRIGSAIFEQGKN